MDNIKAIVVVARGTMEDAHKSTVQLTDIAHFEKFDAVYATYFTDIKPARDMVGSILGKNIRVEINIIFELSNS
ncbi:Rid family hydrolase [Arenibacter sp. F26102]|nr:Rid family hydrolase [Arenibacter sp. F26102]